MHITFLFLLAFVAFVISAKVPHKAVIISYPEDVDQSVVTKAMDAVRDAGGKITHEYKFFKGFACKAPQKILDTVQTWGNDHGAVIEEVKLVTIA